MMENVTKSIIYGNIYENRYGKFLPVCSSISDRGINLVNKRQFNQSWTIFATPLTLKNTIESHMHLELRRLQSSSSLRKRMFKISILTEAIVMKQSKAQDKNCYIYLKNLVKI